MNLKLRIFVGKSFIWALLLSAAAIPGGCVSKRGLERETFALYSVPLTNAVAQNSQPVLAIRTLEVSPVFASRAFVYRMGDDRYQQDPYAGFLVFSASALAGPVRNHLRNSGLFKSVAESGSQIGADLYLEVYVTELYGDIRPSAQPAAVLTMRFLFFDGKSGKPTQPFFEKTYTRRVPLPQKTPSALVAGWNQALAQIMTQVASDETLAQAQRPGHPQQS